MTQEEIHILSKQAATDIIEWCCRKNVNANSNYPTERIQGLLEDMQRKIDQANEDGELLAYKKGRRDMINQACAWLELCAKEYTSAELRKEFRKAMEE